MLVQHVAGVGHCAGPEWSAFRSALHKPAVMHNLRPYVRKERGVDAKWGVDLGSLAPRAHRGDIPAVEGRVGGGGGRPGRRRVTRIMVVFEAAHKAACEWYATWMNGK